jgi:NADH-quinone oxidoreductase subunit E
MIFRKPVGRHVILLCDSISCWIKGVDPLRGHVNTRLNVSMGQTSADGRFTLLPIVCLGACDHAPVMMIDDDLHENLTTEKIDSILDQYP